MTFEHICTETVDFVIADEVAADVQAREALLDRAMGAGRKRKSSEKLRRGRLVAEGLAFVARSSEGQLIGTVRLWNVAVNDKPMLLLGPLAVDNVAAGQGVGSALMRHAIHRARLLGHGAIVLVGDPAYYRRFGFSAELTGGLMMPGPVERHRLLAIELTADSLDAAGLLVATGGRETRQRMPAASDVNRAA